MTCTQSNELFLGALYHELSAEEQKEFDGHLASCADCASSFRGMQGTLLLMDKRTRPEPDEAYWRAYSKNVQEKLAAGAAATPRLLPPRGNRPRLHGPVWSYGIAATLLLVAGIYLGRTYFGGRSGEADPRPGAVTQQVAQNDSINAMALAYLERSKNLLLGFVNDDGDRSTPPDLHQRQEISRQLIENAHFLNAALNRPDQQRMRRLIGELEVILLELANVEVGPGKPAVELVKRGVDHRSILLKINIEEMRAASKKPARPMTAKPTI
jgi:hypothetical protein